MNCNMRKPHYMRRLRFSWRRLPLQKLLQRLARQNQNRIINMTGMTTAEKLPVSLTTFAADGVTPEPINGPMVWLSSDESIMTAATSSDGLSGFAVSVGPGIAHFTWSAD